ncbi:ATP-dependent helicase HrpB [Pseudoalteromonas sp.]|uniref:ATP-dependent helicase HrpB n=1 Tax=Pseudoalteromonas sp. TaxID=53249 RepID=UPI00356B55B1
MLPIQSVYHTLVTELSNNERVVLQAPPGAGKSTWLPFQLIKDNHFKRIIMLEPRRLAARNIASFLAECLDEPLGQTIGLRIRGESIVSKQTRLEIVTEGMLTRMLQDDPELNGIDLVIFDEFHERSIQAETALALAFEVQQAYRDDLKLLIMSATLDGERLSAEFDAPLVQSEGRQFPISEVYTPLTSEADWLSQIVPLTLKAMAEQTGSALVFLPGVKEIKAVESALFDARNAGLIEQNIAIYALFGKQDKKTQQAALKPCEGDKRKIVLTTNVAETSLTIDGIRIVVDSGKEKITQYNVKNGISQLLTVNIAKSSAVQRAGRAGRIEAGVVYRLGSKELFERRANHATPEILRSDISQLVLECANWGTHIHDLVLLDKPSAKQIAAATELLLMLEAIDADGKITTLGKKMLSYGTELRFAHMLIKAEQLDADYPGIYHLAVYLVALFTSQTNRSSDIATGVSLQLNTPHGSFEKELTLWLKRLKLKAVRTLCLEYLSLVMALAFPDRIAQKRGNGLRLANGAGATLHSDFLLQDPLLCIGDMGGATGQHVFNACKCDLTLIESALPYLFSNKDITQFDENTGRFIAETHYCLGQLVLSRKPSSKTLSADEKAAAWCAIIAKKGWQLITLDEEAEQYIVRLTLAHKYLPNEFPAINKQFLFDSLASWLAPYLRDVNSLAALKKIAILPALKNLIDWQQQTRLDELLPERLAVPTGSKLKIQYQVDGPAKLAVKMQEMYGVATTPTLAGGHLALAIELLSPAMRPLQITQDLAGFWASSYREVQKEMKGRYPKHFWPDDPANAKATNKVKSRM